MRYMTAPLRYCTMDDALWMMDEQNSTNIATFICNEFYDIFTTTNLEAKTVVALLSSMTL